MLLSIAMIVKNEENRLRECLNSIKPILDQLHSELIICDTGSTDSTMEIAKEFTDNIHEIGWRNDFSWARNQSLKLCKGKWYMWVDADEVYQDVNDIIRFFNEGEYKKFDTASIIWENILDDKGSTSSFKPVKLFKIVKNLRWHDKIHEYILPLLTPTKELTTLAFHYGYHYESEDAKKAKAERNLAPMLEQFKDDPKDIRNINHIIQHYNGTKEWEESKKYIDIGLKLFDKNTDHAFYHAVRQQLILNYFLTDKWEETVTAVREYFTDAPKLFANASYLKFQESSALVKIMRYEEAGDAAVEAYNYLEQRKKGELDTFILSIVTIAEVSEADIITGIVANYTFAGCFDLAFEWKNKFPDGDPRKDADIFNMFAEFTSKAQIDKIPMLYDYAMTKYGIGSTEYDNALAAIERNLTTIKQKEQVADAFIAGREDFGDGYIRLQHLRKLDIEGDTAAKEALAYFLRTDKEFSQHFGDVLVAAIKYKADLTNITQKMHITNFTEFIVNTLRTTEGFSGMLVDYLKELRFVEECENIKNLRVLSGILSVLTEIEPTIVDNRDQKTKDKMQVVLFEVYAKIKHKFLKMVYREDVYCEDMIKSLPEQDGFAYYTGLAYEFKDKGDKINFAKNLKLSLKMLPGMKDIISRVVEEFKEEEAAPSVHDQLAKETARLKSIIYTMINTGNNVQAAQILEGYALANPTDPEIDTIREKISSKG